MSRPTLVDKVEAMASLACIKNLSPSGLRIGIRLLYHYNCQTLRCDPGVEHLSEATGLDQRTVYRAIKELEHLGLFWIEHRRGRRNTNSYRPNFSRITALGKGESPPPLRPGIENQEPLTARSTKPDNLGQKSLSGVSGEQVKEHLNEQGTQQLPIFNPFIANSALKTAQQHNQQTRQRDPMTIDWAGWIRWLTSIRVREPVLWIFNAIDRIELEANFNQDEAKLLLDKCLRKARAIKAGAHSLDALLTEAISNRIQRS